MDRRPSSASAPGTTVLDLGAGTGKLTRALVATGAEVIAVEPGDAMRSELERAVPEVEALRGAAEAIPLPDGRVDAITVGQAFHWFRHDEAIARAPPRAPPGAASRWSGTRATRTSRCSSEVSELIAPFVPSDRRRRRWTRPAARRERRSSGDSKSGASRSRRSSMRTRSRSGIALVELRRGGGARRARRELERESARARGSAAAVASLFAYVTAVYVSRAV